MPTIDIPQGRLAYSAAGPEDSSAPPVVLLHGLLVDGRLWRSVAERLAAAGIRSYAPDLPMGAHRIPLGPEVDLTPRGVARIVLDFLAALDLDDVTLVGNDTGGAICQFVIDTDASRIGRLLLTNCDAFDKFPPPPFNLLVKAGRSRTMLKAMAASTRPTFLRHSALGYGPLAHNLDAELTASWLEPLQSDPAIRDDTARFMAGIRPDDLLDVATRLPAFPRPVRLVWGDADRFFRLDFARRLVEVFPDAELTTVPNGRTFLPLDEPDAVADAIGSVEFGRHKA
jgi:pimeloyl-ACP methyl ester carboxylesterase